MLFADVIAFGWWLEIETLLLQFGFCSDVATRHMDFIPALGHLLGRFVRVLQCPTFLVVRALDDVHLPVIRNLYHEVMNSVAKIVGRR